MKFHTFMDRVKKYFRRNREKNRKIQKKVKDIALNQDPVSADAIVKRETDGDGGGIPH